VDDEAAVRASIDDPSRFGVIFERHHARIWSYIARLTGRDRADELAGDVFTTAFARRQTFDPTRGPVVAWLYGIASNVLRTRLRSDARAAVAFERAAGQVAPEASPIEAADDTMATREQVARVRRALAQLSASDREAIVLYAWERLSYQDIASVLGVEVGTVRSRLSRGRARLRELLTAHGEVLGELSTFEGGR
jgi:RNA polymerase sigma factor (sigma-70 family)